MSKPTPGPYTIGPLGLGYEVRGIHNVCVGTFGRAWVAGLKGSHAVETPEAEANARAWVEGREAIATLEKIRAAMAMVAPCERAYEVRDRVLAILEGKEST